MSINDFSWNRVRTALICFDKSESFYINNDILTNLTNINLSENESLVVPFPYHKQTIVLNTNGRGLLYHHDNPGIRPIYKLVMPADVQLMVKEIWKILKEPSKIPINYKLN